MAWPPAVPARYKARRGTCRAHGPTEFRHRGGHCRPAASQRWPVAVAPILSLPSQCRQLIRLVLLAQGPYDRVQVALHDLVQLIQGQVDAMIREPALWEIVGA